MHKSVLGLALAAGLAAGPVLAANAKLEAPIHQFVDSFNKGDMKGATAANAAGGISIIDEPPPYYWSGPGAFAGWAAAVDKDAKAHSDTDGKVTLGAASRADVTGDHAYVVMPATYSYNEKGVAMREPAHFVFALVREAGGWKIAAWTWAGGKPTPAPIPKVPTLPAKPAAAAKQ
ncbi:MAG TPA: nuclear transport factor 2 family protein [Caulobacteraceae bacterium]|jgi:hypothetical protein